MQSISETVRGTNIITMKYQIYALIKSVFSNEITLNDLE